MQNLKLYQDLDCVDHFFKNGVIEALLLDF